ncbi:MAG: 4'-phosphopantetheinyl transferase family protein [Sphingobacteriaceae bacterium]
MGLSYQKNIDQNTSFAVWKIEETEQELYAQLQLDEREKAYFETLQHNKRSIHWLSTRVLLRKMLQTDEYIDCQVDEHGKPYLVNFPHHISLSHSYDYAAVMISEKKLVGIDIELIKPKIERLADKFLSPQEMAFIHPAQAVNHLYVCWCAKEAIYKLQGRGNVSFKEHIHLQPFSYRDAGQLHAELKLENKHWPLEVHFEKFGDYMLGYVSSEEDVHAK